jgi:hypothetical protein
MVDYIIELDDQPRIEKLRSEISSLVDRFVTDSSSQIEKIILAADFQNAVKENLHGQENGYNPIHDYGIAVAKTIPYLSDNEPRYVIVFDLRIFNEVLGAQLESFVDRQSKVIHELIHIKNFKLLFNSLENPDDFLREPSGKSETMVVNAWRLWQEYDSERTVAEILDDAIKAATSQSSTIDFNYSLRMADDALTRLNEIGPFIRDRIRRFRNWEIDINEISRTIPTRIAGICMLLAYAYAVRDVSPSMRNRIASIESNPNYTQFFRVGWEGILKRLSEYYDDRNTYRLDLLRAIGEDYDAILLACGLEVSDAENGFYVSVRDVP